MPGIKKLYVHLVVLFSVFVGGVAFVSVPVAFAAAPFSDDFNSYSTGDLGGQGSWIGASAATVVSTPCVSGKCIQDTSLNGVYKTGTPLLTGSFVFSFQFASLPANGNLYQPRLYNNALGVTLAPVGIGQYGGTGTVDVVNMNTGGHIITAISTGAYHTMTMGWTITASTHTCVITIQVDSGSPQTIAPAYDNCYGDGSYFDTGVGGFYSQGGGTSMLLDDLGAGAPPPPAPDTSHTQFYSFTPTLGTTTVIATSSSMLFEATGYVVPQDYVSGDYVFLQFGVNPNAAGPMFALSYALSPATYQDFTYPLTSSGAFTASTTIDASAPGVVPVYWSIKHCGWKLFGFCFGLTSTVTYSSYVALGTTTQAQYDATLPVVQATGGAIGTFAATSTIDVNTGTSTAFSSSFNLVSAITNKFPFNWVVSYADVLSNLGSSTGQLGSTTVDTSHIITYTGVPAVTMDFSGLRLLQHPFASSTASSSLVITMFSAATLNQVAAIPAIQTMRLFISWFLWLELMMYAWRAASAQVFQGAEAK